MAASPLAVRRTGHGGTIRGEDRDGLTGSRSRWWRRWCWTGPYVAPAAGQSRDGDPGQLMVLWPVHLASGRAGACSNDGAFPFTGRMPTVLVLTLIFGFRDRRGRYPPGRVALPEALRRWERRNELIGRRTSRRTRLHPCRPADTWPAPSRSCPLARSADRAAVTAAMDRSPRRNENDRRVPRRPRRRSRVCRIPR